VRYGTTWAEDHGGFGGNKSLIEFGATVPLQIDSVFGMIQTKYTLFTIMEDHFPCS
jgi:hypothetical protein